jgi:hypothetical protein
MICSFAHLPWQANASECKAQSQKATIPADRSTEISSYPEISRDIIKKSRKNKSKRDGKKHIKNENMFISLIPLCDLCDGLQQAYLKLSSVFPKRRDPVVPTSKR